MCNDRNWSKTIFITKMIKFRRKILCELAFYFFVTDWFWFKVNWVTVRVSLQKDFVSYIQSIISVIWRFIIGQFLSLHNLNSTFMFQTLSVDLLWLMSDKIFIKLFYLKQILLSLIMMEAFIKCFLSPVFIASDCRLKHWNIYQMVLFIEFSFELNNDAFLLWPGI